MQYEKDLKKNEDKRASLSSAATAAPQANTANGNSEVKK
jgi:hypothetical protein